MHLCANEGGSRPQSDDSPKNHFTRLLKRLYIVANYKYYKARTEPFDRVLKETYGNSYT